MKLISRRFTKVIVFLTLILSAAASFAANSFDEYETGTVDRNSLNVLVRSVDNQFVAEIQHQIKQHCNEAGCALATITRQEKGFTFNFGCGEGGLAAGGGTNYYIGASNYKVDDSDKVRCGASFTYTNKKCIASFRVPESDFRNFIRYTIGARVPDSPVDMNRLTPEYEFQKRMQLEFARTLQAAGCDGK